MFPTVAASMNTPEAAAPLKPFTTEYEGRVALSEVLLQIREKAGATNWRDFCDIALREAGLEIPEKTLENYGLRPRYSKAPNFGVFFAIEAWNRSRPEQDKFRFANGELVGAVPLMEVALQLRSSSGNLLHRD